MDMASVALVVIFFGVIPVLIWTHEHGEDGHRHRWKYGVMRAGYGFRTCRVCGFREYEVTG